MRKSDCQRTEKRQLGRKGKFGRLGQTNRTWKQHPDIEAKKGFLKRICEVTTEEIFEGDKERYVEFKNYCDEYDFHFYIVDKDGKRRQIDPTKFGKK